MIGDKLKELRDKKGLTLKQMGEILGVSHMTYQRYEKNDTDVSTEMLSKLADFYGVSTDYLLGREKPDDPLEVMGIKVRDVDDDAFIKMYRELPDNAKCVFLDVMKKLAGAGTGERENELTVSMECGALEDSAREKDDISAG